MPTAELIDHATGEVTADPAVKTLSIPRGVLCAARICSPETDLPISGIRLSRTLDGDMHASATDGRSVLRVEWTDTNLLPRDEGACVIPAELALGAEKQIPKKPRCPEHGMVRLTLREPGDGTPAGIELHVDRGADRVTIDGMALPGDFPDADGAIPAYTAASAAFARLSVELLTELLQAMKLCGSDEVELGVPIATGRPILLIGSGDEQDGRRVTGALMPLSVTTGEVALDREARAAAPLAELVSGGTFESMTISSGGESVKIDKAGANRILSRAGNAVGGSLEWGEVEEDRWEAASRAMPGDEDTAYAYVVTYDPDDSRWHVAESSRELLPKATKDWPTFSDQASARAWCRDRDLDLADGKPVVATADGRKITPKQMMGEIGAAFSK